MQKSLKKLYRGLLLEAKKKDFEELISTGVLSQEVFDKIIFKNNNFKGPFKDSIFNDIIYRSLKNNIKINFSELTKIYELYKQNIQEPINQNKAELSFKKDNQTISLNNLLINNEIDINHIKDYLTFKENANPQKTNLENIINTAYKSGKNEDLELIYDDSNVSVFLIKTMLGSKAVARAYYTENQFFVDDIVQKKGKLIGPMPWCTAADGDNQFNLYASFGLNIYYCIKKETDQSGYGRISIGYKKDEENNIELSLDTEFAVTVSANQKLLDEEKINNIIGVNAHNEIKKDLLNNKRSITKPEDVYWSEYSFDTFKRELQRFCKPDTNNDVKEQFLSKINNLLIYSKKENTDNIAKELISSNNDLIYAKLSSKDILMNFAAFKWKNIYNESSPFLVYLLDNQKFYKFFTSMTPESQIKLALNDILQGDLFQWFKQSYSLFLQKLFKILNELILKDKNYSNVLNQSLIDIISNNVDKNDELIKKNVALKMTVYGINANDINKVLGQKKYLEYLFNLKISDNQKNKIIINSINLYIENNGLDFRKNSFFDILFKLLKLNKNQNLIDSILILINDNNIVTEILKKIKENQSNVDASILDAIFYTFVNNNDLTNALKIAKALKNTIYSGDEDKFNSKYGKTIKKIKSQSGLMTYIKSYISSFL